MNCTLHCIVAEMPEVVLALSIERELYITRKPIQEEDKIVSLEKETVKMVRRDGFPRHV